MLTIRFQRAGKKNDPIYRVVLAEKHRSASKKFLEHLATYDPHTKDLAMKDEVRLKYWIEQHVQLSPSVHNLLVTKGILTSAKVKSWRPKVKNTPATSQTPPNPSPTETVAAAEAPPAPPPATTETAA